MLGCGPIGLLILQVLKVAGAGPILAVIRFRIDGRLHPV